MADEWEGPALLEQGARMASEGVEGNLPLHSVGRLPGSAVHAKSGEIHRSASLILESFPGNASTGPAPDRLQQLPAAGRGWEAVPGCVPARELHLGRASCVRGKAGGLCTWISAFSRECCI